MIQIFKDGETYKTRDGHEAHTLKMVGKFLIGYIWLEGCPAPYRWNSDGTGAARHPPYDLMPPMRQVWVALWQVRDCGTVGCTTWDSEFAAEHCAGRSDRRRIAVLGPYDVDDEP